MGLPYFPMFPTDFEAKTSHLTLEEDGAYNRLLRICWMLPNCSIPADENWIMRRMRVDKDTFDRAVKVVIDEFFEVDNGRYSNSKLCQIFHETNEAHKKRVSAGSKGGKAKSLKTKKMISSNSKAKLKQPEPEPEPYIDNNNSEELSSSISGEEGFNFRKALQQCRTALAGCINEASPNMIVEAELRNWISSGCDFELDILPVMKSLAAQLQGKDIRSWAYFSNSVFEHRDRRTVAAPNVHILQSRPQTFAEIEKRNYENAEAKRLAADIERARQYAETEKRVLAGIKAKEMAQ